MSRVIRVDQLRRCFRKRVGYTSYSVSLAALGAAYNRSKAASKQSRENVNKCATSRVDASFTISRYGRWCRY